MRRQLGELQGQGAAVLAGPPAVAPGQRGRRRQRQRGVDGGPGVEEQGLVLGRVGGGGVGGVGAADTQAPAHQGGSTHHAAPPTQAVPAGPGEPKAPLARHVATTDDAKHGRSVRDGIKR